MNLTVPNKRHYQLHHSFLIQHTFFFSHFTREEKRKLKAPKSPQNTKNLKPPANPQTNLSYQFLIFANYNRRKRNKNKNPTSLLSKKELTPTKGTTLLYPWKLTLPPGVALADHVVTGPLRHRVYKYHRSVHGRISGVPGADLCGEDSKEYNFWRRASFPAGRGFVFVFFRSWEQFFRKARVLFVVAVKKKNKRFFFRGLGKQDLIPVLLHILFRMECKDLQAVCLVLLFCVASTLARE